MIKGSSGNGYKVHVALKGDDMITMFCDCKAGVYGDVCKHKLAVATGDSSFLLDQSDADKLAVMAEKISQVPIGQLLRNFAASRKEHVVAKRKMDRARKALEKAMKGSS